MSGIRSFDLKDDLFDLLEYLKLTNAVLITDGTEKLIGIVTSYDSNEYFRSRAENLMHVEDIEVAVKEFILLAYIDTDGEIDEKRLAKAVTKVGSHGNDRDVGFGDLTLADYISLLGQQRTWPIFDPIFRMPWRAVRVMLDDVRQTRNQLAHFRSEITAAQTDQLRFCAEWLARCRERYDELNAQEIDASPATDPIDANIADGANTIIAEETQLRESKYAALADWLQSQPGQIDRIELSFDKIEEIIGSNLPASALKHRSWWSNDVQGHPHAQLWLDADWRTTSLNMTEQRVTFARMREREKAYVNFFGHLIGELRSTGDFPVREVSPDGANWLTVQLIADPKPSVAGFHYSFARGKRFRVELYIDTGEQETTKQIFDLISAHRSELETQLGRISWERIDHKRASRIALYHPGTITDDEQILTDLRQWAVENMVAFYKIMEPVASAAIQEVLYA